MSKTAFNPRTLPELIAFINTLFEDVQKQKRKLDAVIGKKDQTVKAGEKLPSIYVGDIYKPLSRACYDLLLIPTVQGLVVTPAAEKELTKAMMLVDKHDLSKRFFSLTKAGKNFRLYFWLSVPDN